MASEFKALRRVEFSETDMAGIVHYANFFRYMEAAEHAFFRSLGTSIVDKVLHVGWPRVHAECDYRKPLCFEDEVTVRLLVTAKNARSLRYQFRFLRGDEEVARGALTVVCVSRDEHGEMKATNIPAAITDRIEVAAPDQLA